MPAGMPKVVAFALPRRLVAALVAAFPVEVEGTAVGVADCADMMEMVSVAEERSATCCFKEVVLSSTSVKLYRPECYRILSPCALALYSDN